MREVWSAGDGAALSRDREQKGLAIGKVGELFEVVEGRATAVDADFTLDIARDTDNIGHVVVKSCSNRGVLVH